MPTTVPEKRLQVAVGVLQRQDHYLVQQRLIGKPCAGQWEFPGGKLEADESPWQALQRELAEELAVAVNDGELLMQVQHDYDHAKVELWIYLVTDFTHEPHSAEGQVLTWATTEQIAGMDILPAVVPILHKLKSLSA